MSPRVILLNQSKNTIGYKESDNKNEFEKGAQVALSKAEDYYTEIIENLKTQLIHEEQSHEEAVNDLNTLNRILNKYQPD